MTKSHSAIFPFSAAVAAIILSPAAQLTTGQPITFALATGVVAAVLWAAQRLTRAQVGLVLGNMRGMVVALIVPLAAMIATGLLAMIVDGLAMAAVPISDILRMAAMSFLITFVLALLTEEGLFRGALWGSCRRAGWSDSKSLVFTAAAFALWHIAAAFLIPGFELPEPIIPIYVGNMLMIGLMFGLVRMVSGSLVQASIAHALWNTITYGFFGNGTGRGLLGIEDFATFDPERGWVGLLVNIVVVAALWGWAARRRA